ncbi:hypothetical protein BH11MYX1_BH11MYX1_36870 [soil metagenome]
MDPDPGISDGRYRLHSELARGGMGRVWIADDTKLSRRVAIKELLEPSGRDRARFERELSLTSRLEHPSIVGVQDGGTWSDGKPFYVMRLVRGESLDKVVARATTLAARISLLPHGLAMVDAIAYAHDQGIVHRDLKPENVLVGDFGETVVIDWGLAKDLRAATPALVEGPYRNLVRLGETLGGEVMGTPAYMPPEQALGDAVDERADVYSIGAVLYHLLCGSRPYGGTSIDDILAKVINEEPPPLAKRAAGVPTDLVTIVEKAMARRPEDRYANATELAVDLKRFLGGQLVGAHRYSGPQLVWRWMRKHRGAVVTAAVATVAVVGLAVASFTRIVREEHRANIARALAERNHAKAEHLLDFMLVDLRSRLEPVGKLDLLDAVAFEARDYYRDQVEATSEADRHRRALVHHGLGKVLAAKGDTSAALAEHQAALAIHPRLAADDPSWRGSVAESSILVGDALRAHGDSEAALAAYTAAIAADEAIGDRAQLAVAYASLGDFYAEVRRDDSAALRTQLLALALRRQLAAAAPNDLASGRALVASLAAFADMTMQLGDFAKAKRVFEEALAIAEAVVAKDGNDAMSLLVLADRHEELGGVLHNQGDPRAGLEHYETTLAIRTRVATKDPTNAQVRSLLARTEMNIGQALDDQGKLVPALQHQRAALEIVEGLLRADDSNARLRGLHAFLRGLIGSLQLRQGHVAKAIVELEASRTATEALSAREPANQKWQRDLVFLYGVLGDARAEAGELEASLVLRHQTIALARTIAAKDPASTTSQADVVDAIERLAETLERAHRPAEAAAGFRDAIAAGDALAALAASNPLWKRRTDELRTHLAGCCASGH